MKTTRNGNSNRSVSGRSKWGDDRDDAEDGQDVVNVRADDVADRERRLAADGTDDRRREFGKRGTEGQHGESDEQLGETEREEQIAPAGDEPSRADHERE